MQTNIEEGEQTKHSAKANQVRKIEEFSERRDRKRKKQEAQRPIASGMLYKFDGIRAEIGVKRAPAKRSEGHQANEEENGFGPLAG
jgi:hypothetical protein